MQRFKLSLSDTHYFGAAIHRLFQKIGDEGFMSGVGNIAKGVTDFCNEAEAPDGGADAPLLAELAKAEIDMTADLVAPDYRFKIGGIEFVAAGSITAITGHAKQGKSQFVTILAATLLSRHDFGALQNVTPCDGVLWFDTEQSNYDIQTNILRLYDLCGYPTKTDAKEMGLHVFALRPYSPLQRMQLITKAIEKYTPEVIIIDGIRDLLNDINNMEQANEVITWLLQTSAAMPHANIFTVIHTNEGNEKMRGNIGSELYNKCADRFDVSKGKGFFSVKHICRHLALQSDFDFYIDDNGHLAPWSAAQSNADMAESPTDILQRIFADGEARQFNEIIKAFAKEAVLSQAKAKPILIEQINLGHLVKRNNKFILTTPQ